MDRRLITKFSLALVVCGLPALPPASAQYFTIVVVDEDTRRGVPLVELRTVNNLTYYTDSQGVVAFLEPALMDRDVYFSVRSHGYEFAADGFGFRGRKLHTTPGTETRIAIKRLQVAERLYRVTGAGIYADSMLVGRTTPVANPLLNAQVLGSDSVQCLVFGGRIYWFWGDTHRLSYPLGNFHVPGATSELPGSEGLDPSDGVNLHYFVGEDGFAKPTCKMPGSGPTWIDGLAVVTDAEGKERMFADFVKVKPPLTVYQRGLVEFNSERSEFESRVIFPADAPILPGGHTFRHPDDQVGHIYFGQPAPTVRVRATPGAIQDLGQYEALTCLVEGSRADDPQVDRDENGRIRYRWKRNTPPISQQLQKKLLAAGKIQPSEGLFQCRDVESGKEVVLHHGSTYWNPYRHRWVLIATQSFGTSALGEIWYLEADNLFGPWTYARKIVTHDRQSFYNPKQHPFFCQQAGRILYFEGTYTHTFSGNDEPTPRYDYNQIMYRLDLDDPRMVLPVAVYSHGNEAGEGFSLRASSGTDPAPDRIVFFACDRPFPGSVTLRREKCSPHPTLTSRADAPGEILFHALPCQGNETVPGTVPLYEHSRETGEKRFLVGEAKAEGFRRSPQPLCRVWINPARQVDE